MPSIQRSRRCRMNDWGWLEWIVTATGAVFAALIATIWKMLGKRITDNSEHIGKLYSKTNDLRVDVERIENEVAHHSDKFTEVKDKIDEVKTDLVKFLEKIEKKVDAVITGQRS